MTFSLTPEQEARFSEWCKEVNQEAVNKQMRNAIDAGRKPDVFESQCWEDGEPYTGAIGGRFTFMFTPNSIGIGVRVKDAVTERELDLSEYDNW